jgi:acyl-CoA dehydrogenase
MILTNPKSYRWPYPDPATAELVAKTIDFFETKGKRRLKEDDRNRVWYADFLDFVRENKAFARLLTPAGYGAADSRWDTWRIAGYNEILAFYGLHYWYTWQVTILGLGPIWMSANEALKRRAAALLDAGEVFAFGLSERAHGADVYSTEMRLDPRPDGSYVANGAKYYIGNGNIAPMVSTFGKLGARCDAGDAGDYVFFVANYQHEGYRCVRNVVNSQSYVSEYVLEDYPVPASEILSAGQAAWDTALNTVNVGKYNLGWASIGICTHALYEAITHAANRHLYGMAVTDFPHVKRMFTDAYARLVAMKLFALRAADYMRVASADDRRYLLYNPVVKMKVTTQGEEVINLLWDVIAAKGFERDTYFEMAARDIRALPKLEGTVHVNIALILKFIANYFFNPADYPPVARQDGIGDDAFLFDQGPARGLGKIRFHDFRPVLAGFDLPNVNRFAEQAAVLGELLVRATPDEQQQRDTDTLLALGELFTLVVYGQLILENARIYGVGDDLVDQICSCLVRDMSEFALQLYSKAGTTPAQMDHCLRMIRKPVVDEARYDRVWRDHVLALAGAYEMNP